MAASRDMACSISGFGHGGSIPPWRDNHRRVARAHTYMDARHVPLIPSPQPPSAASISLVNGAHPHHLCPVCPVLCPVLSLQVLSLQVGATQENQMVPGSTFLVRLRPKDVTVDPADPQFHIFSADTLAELVTYLPQCLEFSCTYINDIHSCASSD